MATVISGDTGVSQVQNNTVSPVKLTQPLTLATAQATTSGTSIDFTGIPSWVKRITIMFNGVSTNGTSRVQVQLGTSGGIETSGYTGLTGYFGGANVTGYTSNSSGLDTAYGQTGSARTGTIVLQLISGNTWIATCALSSVVDTSLVLMGVSKTLSGQLDRVRITTVNGTDTFDAGSVNILYEG